VFSLVQLEGGDAVMSGGQTLPCLSYALGPEEPLVWPFQKGGEIDPPFDHAFYGDPELHLPHGRWEVRAVLDYGYPGCGNTQELAVSISLAVLEAEGSPDPSAVATEPPVGSAPPSPGAPAAPTTDLVWTVTGAFPDEGTSTVTQIMRLDGALVAIGVGYDTELGDFGPVPPHAARAWISTDGREWETIDLGDGFRDADLGTVITLPDGSLLALGDQYRADPGRPLGITEMAAWESTDGRRWTPVARPLPRDLLDVVQGPQGYVAVLFPTPGTAEVYEVWHSPDGRAWSRRYSFAENQNALAVDAGAQGFVVSGRDPTNDRNIVVASSDGLAWFEAEGLPQGAFTKLAAVGSEWVGIDVTAAATHGETWLSPNGLDWSRLGRADLAEISDGSGGSCVEYPHYLSSAGDWLVMGTTVSGPCSEGGFVVHGSPQISLDGAAWTRLPFEPGTPGEARSGSAVNASAVLGGNLILAGEHNGVATFWIGEPR
jgi:hypothetical protein